MKSFIFDPIEHLKKIVLPDGGKIILLVLDGLGGLKIDGKTALETADTPNMDKLAKKYATGLFVPVFPGITPGSGPGHLSLFGYNPLKYDIGRGILETLGLDMEVKIGDITARGNFCTMEGDVVKDRRAGRIPTEENQKLISHISQKIQSIEDVKIILKSGKEHRFAVIFRGEGLGPATDTDPHRDGERLKTSTSSGKGGDKTARIINTFTNKVKEILSDNRPANGILLRGVSLMPEIPQFPEIYKLKAGAIATYPMYRGIAKLVGMEIIPTGTTNREEIDTLIKHFSDYDYFYVHIKKTDSYGEDGDIEKKKSVIEEIDRYIPEILSLKPDVLAITGDHSTPAKMKGHSWHPVPFLLVSNVAREGNSEAFSEKECLKGSLGIFPGIYITSLLLAHSGRLDKYGA